MKALCNFLSRSCYEYTERTGSLLYRKHTRTVVEYSEPGSSLGSAHVRQLHAQHRSALLLLHLVLSCPVVLPLSDIFVHVAPRSASGACAIFRCLDSSCHCLQIPRISMYAACHSNMVSPPRYRRNRRTIDTLSQTISCAASFHC